MITLEKTNKKQLPALWEEGGGYTNTGYAVIVAGENGEALKPVYIRRRGRLANAQHALFIVNEGYIVVIADEHRGDIYVEVKRIESIKVDDENYIAETKTLFDNNYDCRNKEWAEGVEPDEWLKPAVLAAIEKSCCYHCRCPHYIKKDNNES